MTPMIEVKNLIKRYALGETLVEALGGVSFSMERGEFISIMGSSGSGKSTLLHILGALDTPTEGQYLLEGHDIAHLGDGDRARIRNRHFGFIFQSYNLMPELTALKNVELPLIYAKIPTKERRDRSVQKLEQVGLGHLAGAGMLHQITAECFELMTPAEKAAELANATITSSRMF